jgi:hypothetical protein
MRGYSLFLSRIEAMMVTTVEPSMGWIFRVLTPK